MSLPPLVIEDLVRRALLEDFGQGRDSTSEALIAPDKNGVLAMRSRQAGILAGAEIARTAFKSLDHDLEVRLHCHDGAPLSPGQEIMSVSGNARAILGAERTALNFLSHLSGIASETARYVAKVAGTKASIACTRKTLPGLRTVQKYAVRAGGGRNHRFGLGDGVLIKDNHIAVCGGIGHALEQARRHAGHMVKIEIEVDTLAQLEEALRYPVDAVLLDNMTPDQLREAIGLIGDRALAEASGNITLETVRAVAETGVDIISVGALTHSVKALDIGLDINL